MGVEMQQMQTIKHDPSFLRWVLDGNDVIEILDAYLAGDAIIFDGNSYKRIRRELAAEVAKTPELSFVVFGEPLLTPEGRHRVKSILAAYANKIGATTDMKMSEIEEMVGNILEPIAVEFAANWEKTFYDVSAFERVMLEIKDFMLLSLLRSKNAGLRQALTERIAVSVQEEKQKGGLPIVSNLGNLIRGDKQE